MTLPATCLIFSKRWSGSKQSLLRWLNETHFNHHLDSLGGRSRRTANVIVNNTGITGVGTFFWTFDFQLSKDQNAIAGLAPTVNPVPYVNLTFGAFVTIYGFEGYVPGTCSGPAGWTCTVQNTGVTPDDVTPTDDPNIVNITWPYTSCATILGQPNGVDLGQFSASSIFRLRPR